MNCALIDWIDRLLLGSLIKLDQADRLLRKAQVAYTKKLYHKDKRLGIDLELLTRELEQSVDTIQRIENKAMGTLMGIAVALVVFGATSEVLGKSGPFYPCSTVCRAAMAAALVAAMLYLIGSGLLALYAYKIGEVYSPDLFDLPPLVEPEEQHRVIIYCIEQNRIAGTIRSNKLSASFNLLRNGLITVFLVGSCITFARL